MTSPLSTRRYILVCCLYNADSTNFGKLDELLGLMRREELSLAYPLGDLVVSRLKISNITQTNTSTIKATL